MPRIFWLLLVISFQTQAFAQVHTTEPIPVSAEGDARNVTIRATGDEFTLNEHAAWGTTTGSRAQIPGMDGPAHRTTFTRARQPASFHRLSYLPHVRAAERRFTLPPGLLDALIWKESRYDTFAVSPAGAAGLGQLMPKTARELGVRNRFDPLANLYAAARYLRQQLDRFGQVHLALAAYNAGPGAVLRAGGIPRNRETPAYVLDILRRWQPDG